MWAEWGIARQTGTQGQTVREARVCMARNREKEVLREGRNIIIQEMEQGAPRELTCLGGPGEDLHGWRVERKVQVNAGGGGVESGGP